MIIIYKIIVECTCNYKREISDFPSKKYSLITCTYSSLKFTLSIAKLFTVPIDYLLVWG